METLPVTWETFVARRRLNVREWLISNGVKDYRGMVSLLQKKGIAPPAFTSVESLFRRPKKAPPKAPKIDPIIPPSLTVEPSPGTQETLEDLPKKKRGRKKAQNNKDLE